MNFQPVIQSYQAHPALQELVIRYTVALPVGGEDIVSVLPAFPQQYLIFYPYSPQKFSYDGASFQPLSRELLIGPFTKSVRLSITPAHPTIIVTLVPGALHRLIRMPLNEILNQPTDGVVGFGNEIGALNAQLADSKTPLEMIMRIETFLLKKIAKAKAGLPIDQIYRLVIASPGQNTIEQLASLACVSLRQFERQFLSRIGMSPGTFIRQARFAKAYGLKRMNPKSTWTSIAFECGYFDQMHLIRDFKSFTSLTPANFQGFGSPRGA